MDALAALGEATRALAEAERRVLTLLALTEPRNISNLTELAKLAGVRESASRQVSTASLRGVLEPLMRRRLVVEDEGWYRCAPGVRHPALRLAAHDGSLQLLAGAIAPRLFHRLPWSAQDRERLSFELLVQLASVDARADETLSALVAIEAPHLIVESVLLPALVHPFDAAWFDGLPPSLRTRLLELGLAHVEALGFPLGRLYEHLAANLALVAGSVAASAALAGLTLLRGDFGFARTLAEFQGIDAGVRRGIEGALALCEGRVEDAVGVFAASKKPVLCPGVIGVLQVLALLGRGGPVDLELAGRLSATAARKKSAFRQTHGILSSMAQVASSSMFARLAPHVASREPARDCFAGLLRLLFVAWFEVPEHEREMASEEVLEIREVLTRFEMNWLLGQYDAALRAVGPGLADVQEQKTNAPGSVHGQPVFALHALRSLKEPWEDALEGLERIALASGGRSAAAEPLSDERLIWKVDYRRFEIEPFLQKRSGADWTRGRKLAVKHLMKGSAATRKLPPEDEKVAAFARELRDFHGGYSQLTHYIDTKAWTALIGHPRVFTADERHVEVTRGTVQVTASTEGDRFVLKVEPADLHRDLELRFDGQRIVVFEITEPVRSLANLLGARGLSVPVSAQQRALDALGGLAHLVPVHSSLQTSARTVTADAMPWLRLVPRTGGLAVSLSVRPLGGDGPHVTPGKGARTLVGRASGEAVQTDRALEEEQRLADQVMQECAALEGCETGEGAWFVEDPEMCLELVSALKGMEGRVHVEWPEGSPLRLRARVSASSFRGQLLRDGPSFFATGSFGIDGELSLELDQLVALLAEQPGKFLRLDSGEYVELEHQLRELLESLGSFHPERRAKQRGIVVPGTALTVLERLTDEGSGLALDQSSLEWRKRLLQATNARVPVPRGLNAELRDYQLTGFRWLARLAALELGACLADDMGLGKTVQLIALLLHRGRTGPALVVAPTSVCENWRRELARFAPTLEVRSFLGAGREEVLGALSQRHVVLTSYALLQQDAERLQAVEWSTVILDEAQLIKNAESQRAKAAFGLRTGVRIASTGTPVENRLGDVFSIFHFLMPDLLGSWAHFSRRFGANAAGETGGSGRRALRKLLLPFILRRTKAQVLDDLPALTEIERTVTLGPEEAALYEAVRRAAVAKLGAAADPRARLQVLAEITRLRRLCCHPELAVPGTSASSSKIASFLELVDELLEGRHRALVFSQFVDVLARVRAELDRRAIAYQYLDGSTPPKQRAAAVDAFQAGEGALFLISLRAGGFGLNLTGADYVIHLDPWWNPAVEAQASDRAHRIGQTRPVTVYRLIAAGTVEERIVALHRSKRELADSLLADTDQSATLSVEDLRALLDE